MVRFAGPQVGVFPLLSWQGQSGQPARHAPPQLELQRVSIPSRKPDPLQIFSAAPPGTARPKRPLIGLQDETERNQASRCVVEGRRMYAGVADIYLRHSTALVLQETEGYCPASAKHDLIGVTVDRRRS